MSTPNYLANNDPIVIEIKKRSDKLSSLSLYNLSILHILSFLEDAMIVEKAAIVCISDNDDEVEIYDYGPGLTMEALKDLIIDKLAYKIISIEIKLEHNINIECNAVDEFYLDFNHHFDIDAFIKGILREQSTSYINPNWIQVNSICLVVEDIQIKYFQSFSHYINRGRSIASS